MSEVNKLNHELWDSRIRDWGDSAATIAFESLGMEPTSEVDIIDVTSKQADEIYEIGKKNHILASQASLGIFCIEMNLDENSRITDLVQPSAPFFNDLWIYRLIATFIARNDGLACGVSLEESHRSTAGPEEVAVLWIFDDYEGGYSVTPYTLNDEGLYCTDYETLRNLGQWLGHFFSGVQYKLINRPERIRISHRRIPSDEIKSRQVSEGMRTVKVQKIISILAEEDVDIPVTHSSRKITKPVWGVCGHWRVCKSGKRVWVHPYKKGRDRNNSSAYCGKKYQFEEE